MGMTETLVFYLLVGIVVSVAMYLAEGVRGPKRVAFLLGTAVFFWPLYLPLLLSGRATAPAEGNKPALHPDEMAAAISQVERELIAALESLDGWPETALAREQGRVGELRTALTAQATRIREIDSLLGSTAPTDEFNLQTQPAGALDAAAVDRWQKSQRSRKQNFTRLATIRRQSHADLMATLAWIRELVSMIHLAKFTGAPASRTEELVAQIEAAIEGVSLVGWSEDHESPSPLYPDSQNQPQDAIA